MFIIAQLLLGSYITRKLKIFGALLDPEKDIFTRFQSSMRALLPMGSVVQTGTTDFSPKTISPSAGENSGDLA